MCEGEDDMNGKECWYVVDGYRPPVNAGGRSDYKGHECYMILNCNEADAHVLIDIFYKDKPPVLGIPFTVPAQRMANFYSDEVETLGGVKLDIGEDYSMRLEAISVWWCSMVGWISTSPIWRTSLRWATQNERGSV